MSGRAKGKRKQRKLSRSLKEQLRALAAMPDEEIDTSDIPETADWSRAARGRFYRGEGERQ